MTPTDASPHGTDMVVRRGKLFECGDFADKNFSMSPDELRLAVEGFTGPLPIDLEHVPTVLDGKLGHVDSVWLSEDGRELHGSVSIPSWLDGLLLDGERKVSATWHRATKALEKLALVRSPRVKDAVLFAAFSAAHPDEVEATFATPRKHHGHATAHHQLIHDTIAAGYPSVCTGGPMRPPGSGMSMVGMSEGESAYFADHPEQLKALSQIHRTTTDNGAVCPGSGKVKMSESNHLSGTNSMPNATAVETPEVEVSEDEITEFVSESKLYKDAIARAEAAEAKLTATATQPVKFSDTDEHKALQARLVLAEKALETARLEKIKRESVAFANGEIQAGRAVSAEYDDLVADFSDAAEADHKTGETVTFSDGTGGTKTGSRVEKLIARAARKPSHGLFNPALGDGGLLHDGERILFNNKSNVGSEAEERKAADAILNLTPEGKALLKRRDSKSR